MLRIAVVAIVVVLAVVGYALWAAVRHGLRADQSRHRVTGADRTRTH